MNYQFNPLKQGRNPASAFIPDNPHLRIKLTFGTPVRDESIMVPVKACSASPRIAEVDFLKGGSPMNEEMEFKPAKSIQAFMPVGGGIQVKLRPPGAPAPALGKPFIGPASVMGMDQKPLKLPDPAAKPMIAEMPQPILLTERQEPLQMPPPPMPKIEDPKVQVSIERVVFLERLEKLMGDDSKLKELEAENRTLIRAIARLQEELDALKGKAEKVMA